MGDTIVGAEVIHSLHGHGAGLLDLQPAVGDREVIGLLEIIAACSHRDVIGIQAHQVTGVGVGIGAGGNVRTAGNRHGHTTRRGGRPVAVSHLVLDGGPGDGLLGAGVGQGVGVARHPQLQLRCPHSEHRVVGTVLVGCNLGDLGPSRAAYVVLAIRAVVQVEVACSKALGPVAGIGLPGGGLGHGGSGVVAGADVDAGPSQEPVAGTVRSGRDDNSLVDIDVHIFLEGILAGVLVPVDMGRGLRLGILVHRSQGDDELAVLHLCKGAVRAEHLGGRIGLATQLPTSELLALGPVLAGGSRGSEDICLVRIGKRVHMAVGGGAVGVDELYGQAAGLDDGVVAPFRIEREHAHHRVVAIIVILHAHGVIGALVHDGKGFPGDPRREVPRVDAILIRVPADQGVVAGPLPGGLGQVGVVDHGPIGRPELEGLLGIDRAAPRVDDHVVLDRCDLGVDDLARGGHLGSRPGNGGRQGGVLAPTDEVVAVLRLDCRSLGLVGCQGLVIGDVPDLADLLAIVHEDEVALHTVVLDVEDRAVAGLLAGVLLARCPGGIGFSGRIVSRRPAGSRHTAAGRPRIARNVHPHESSGDVETGFVGVHHIASGTRRLIDSRVVHALRVEVDGGVRIGLLVALDGVGGAPVRRATEQGALEGAQVGDAVPVGVPRCRP